MPFMIHRFFPSDMESDPCYQMAKAQGWLGPGKLKWDDGMSKLGCYDGNGSVDCDSENGETNLTYDCGMHDVIVTF